MAESKPVVSKVKMPSKVIRIEDGETSCQGRDQLVISFEAQTQIGLSREERVKMFKEEIVQKSKTPKVQKVKFLLRDKKRFVKYYVPRVVSFGPIHHGKEEYRHAETVKRQLAKVFVKRSHKTIEEICEAVDRKIKELRECFEEEATKKYNDIDLTWILVVDGCAILQYIDLAINDNFKDYNIKNDSVAFCQRDLFLLENQVPYLLLELLMSLSNVGNELRNSVEEFIKINHQMVLRDKSSDPKSWEQPENPTHLLDLLRSSLLGPKSPEKQSQEVASNGRKRNRNKSSDWQSYGNVHELKAAGIHVKPNRDNSLRGIYFDIFLPLFQGRLSLPPLIVDDSTGPKLLNLIAYEMCPDFDNDFGITSYVSFLDSIIDEANDVKGLRKAHVLFNLLGSDEEVAQLFNEIGRDLVPHREEHEHVRTQIQQYCDKKWGKWLAEFKHNCFHSPWTLLAVLGALLGLALSATQTWYTVDSPPGPCDKFCENLNQNLRKG